MSPCCCADSEVSTSNFCISLDRGYGHIEAQQTLSDRGIYSNSMMQKDRVGLPRNFITDLAKDLGKCSGGGEVESGEADLCAQIEEGAPGLGKRKRQEKCTHSPEEPNCQRFCWTAVHKGEWELQLWQDSSLIICLTNFFSSTRCGLLARGAHASKDSFVVWSPEGIWHYNVQGRSATDGHDQQRKKLCMAERRIVRAGHKGIAFVFDLALTNMSIIWRELAQRTGMSMAKLNKQYNKVRACLMIAPVVLLVERCPEACACACML